MTRSRDSHLFTDSSYLRTEQYRDSRNLSARARLHERFSANRYGWPRWVFDHIEVPADGRVLELGCGTGDLWRQNSGRVPLGWRLIVTDLSAGMVEETRRRWPDDIRPSTHGVFDVQRLPLSDDCVDVVIANHMLHHVPDIPPVLQEIRRVLRLGGALFATAVGSQNMRELPELVATFDAHVQRDRVLPWLNFTLESGSELLAENFDHAEVFSYPDALKVTEASLLVDYVASLIAGETVCSSWCEAFRESASRAIADQGAIHISKESGLFKAW